MNLAFSRLMSSANTLVHAELLRREREGIVVEVRRHGPTSLFSKFRAKIDVETYSNGPRTFRPRDLGRADNATVYCEALRNTRAVDAAADGGTAGGGICAACI